MGAATDIGAGRPAESDSTSLLHHLIGLTQRMALLFGIYVYSIGPLYWWWYSSRFVNGSPYIKAFYEPLWLLSRRFPWFGEWLDGYVRMWGAWRL